MSQYGVATVRKRTRPVWEVEVSAAQFRNWIESLIREKHPEFHLGEDVVHVWTQNDEPDPEDVEDADYRVEHGCHDTAFTVLVLADIETVTEANV